MSPTSAAAASAFQAGQDRWRRGDTAAAEALWRRQLARGEDAGLLWVLGCLTFSQHRLTQSQTYFERLARRSPESAEAWFRLGLVRAARGQYRSAADAQRLAVDHAPGFGPGYCALALDLRERGQTVLGLAAARKAVDLMPRYAGAWNLLGDFEQDLGRDAEARSSYDTALRLNPAYPGAWCNLGQLMEKSGRASEARLSYGYALRVDPDYAGALLARAELSMAEGSYGAARADFEACLKAGVAQPEAWWGLRRVDRALGLADSAAQALVCYHRSVRDRNRTLDGLAARGMEQPSPYEPGLPLATAGGASEWEGHP